MKKYSKSPAWIFRPLNQNRQSLLIPVIAKQADLSMVVQLNESASAIWEVLSSPMTRDEICSALREKILAQEDAPENWREDIDLCLADLLQIKALEIVS